MSLTDEYILAGLARREQRRLEQIDLMSPSLLAGDMGSLVFLYEYSRVCPAYRPIADDLLDKMLHSLHCGPLQDSMDICPQTNNDECNSLDCIAETKLGEC